MELSELKNEILKQGSKVLILSHKNPDGDTIGAGLALYSLLKNLSVESTLMVTNDFPDFLKWMPGNEHYVITQDTTHDIQQKISDATLIFFIDFNNYERINTIEQLVSNNPAPKILIDHHPNPQTFFDFSFSDTKASSTSELLYNFINNIGWHTYIDKTIAECLFVGIMTDTGCFNHNSSMPETYKIVSELLSLGVDKDAVFDKVYNNFSENRMRLLGYALNEKMVILPELKASYIYLIAAELERFNFKLGDEEGMVNFPLAIRMVNLTAIIIEKQNYIKLSFRSKGKFPTNYLAKKYFHGGGHLNASGGKSFKSMAETIAKFEKVLKNDEILKTFI